MNDYRPTLMKKEIQRLKELLKHAATCPLTQKIVSADVDPDKITACPTCVEIKRTLA